MVSTRSAGMTASGSSAVADGSSGVTNEMYFWPNRVVGQDLHLDVGRELRGGLGPQGDLDHRLLAVLGDLAHLTDEDAVAAHVAELGSCRPARSALIVTIVTVANFLS